MNVLLLFCHRAVVYVEYCRTVAVDMRGYGDSDKPSGICEYTLDKLVEDVNQLITELGLQPKIVISYRQCEVVSNYNCAHVLTALLLVRTPDV